MGRPDSLVNWANCAINRPVYLVNWATDGMDRPVPLVNWAVCAINRPVYVVNWAISSMNRAVPTVNWASWPPGSVREPSERRSGRRPKRVRRASERCPRGGAGQKTGPRIKNGETARGVRWFLAKMVIFSLVVADFGDELFLCTGEMVWHGFLKPPRLCRRFKTAAPEHTNER